MSISPSVVFPNQVAALHRLIRDQSVAVDAIARALESCTPSACTRPCPQCPVAKLAISALVEHAPRRDTGAGIESLAEPDRPALRLIRCEAARRPFR